MIRIVPSLLVLALAGSPALADPWAYVQQTPGKPFPKIHVYSDSGTQWDRVGNLEDGLTFHADARGQCDAGWRTQHASYLKAKANNQDVALADLQIDTDHRSYGPDHGGGWKSHAFSGPYKAPEGASSPQQVCNSLLASRTAGAPNAFRARQQLLASGMSHTLEGSYTLVFYLECAPERKPLFWEDQAATVDADLRATVECHGNPAALDVPEPEPPPAQRDPVTHGIQAMDIWANPGASANYRGFCPKTLHFGGEVDYELRSSAPFDLQYRFFARWGAREIRSEIFTTRYTASGSRNLHSWSLDFPLSPGGGINFQAPTASDEPQVFGGTVALEFVGGVPIHANLQPVQFEVTCVKEGTVIAPVAGGGSLASPMPERETINLDPQSPTRQPANTSVGPTIVKKMPGRVKGPGQPVTFTATIKPETAAANRVATPGDAPPPTKLELRLPDLLITAVAPGGAAGNAPGGSAGNVVRVRVADKGEGAAPATQLTLFLADGMPVRAPVPPIPAGGQREVVVRTPKPVGAGPLRVQVDEAGRIAESDESNNTFVFRGRGK